MEKDYKIVFIYCTVKFFESCNILLIISNYFQNIIDPNSYKFNVMQLFKYIDQMLCSRQTLFMKGINVIKN